MSDPTQEHPTKYTIYNYRAVTLYRCPFQGSFVLVVYSEIGVLQPQINLVWALPVSLAATQGISIDFFSTVTKMFQFAVYPTVSYVFTQSFPNKLGRVAPFGDPRVNGHLTPRRGYRCL